MGSYLSLFHKKFQPSGIAWFYHKYLPNENESRIFQGKLPWLPWPFLQPTEIFLVRPTVSLNLYELRNDLDFVQLTFEKINVDFTTRNKTVKISDLFLKIRKILFENEKQT